MVVVVGGCVVVVVVAGEAVVVVAAVVVVGTLVVDDEDTAVDSAVASPLDSDDPLHAERNARTMNTSQRTLRMRHLPMLIFPTVIVCPASDEVNTTPPVSAHNCTPSRICAACTVMAHLGWRYASCGGKRRLKRACLRGQADPVRVVNRC